MTETVAACYRVVYHCYRVVFTLYDLRVHDGLEEPLRLFLEDVGRSLFALVMTREMSPQVAAFCMRDPGVVRLWGQLQANDNWTVFTPHYEGPPLTADEWLNEARRATNALRPFAAAADAVLNEEEAWPMHNGEWRLE